MTLRTNLLKYKNNVYSQNGEDGIIDKIFEVIGSKNNICCEFGAWDGIHLSNTRNLIAKGWKSVQIEGDKAKFKNLLFNYKNNQRIYCFNEYVNAKQNSLSKILKKYNIFALASQMDFLSIDIDGLDFEVFKSLDIYPRVICIEVNAGHSPNSNKYIKNLIAKKNIGQPLGLFSRVAATKGYKLICYTGNAFYLKENIRGLDKLSDEEAYSQFLTFLADREREWLYLVNLGLVPPFYKYKNPLLSRCRLNISTSRATYLNISSLFKLNLGHLINRKFII